MFQFLSLSNFFFNSACRTFLHKNSGKVITAYDISQLVGEAWPKALTPENLISGFQHSGIYPLCPEKITAEKLAPSASTYHREEKTIDEILAVPEPEKEKGETKKRQPGFVVSGRCITEEEFRREAKQQELDKRAAEQQRKEKREEREKRKKEREAEREKKKKQTRRGKHKTQESDDKSDKESSYHCGECGQPYGEDDELWIGCDGLCNGWYHILCVGIAEQSIPENFYCERCTS